MKYIYANVSADRMAGKGIDFVGYSQIRQTKSACAPPSAQPDADHIEAISSNLFDFCPGCTILFAILLFAHGRIGDRFEELSLSPGHMGQ